MRGATQTRNRRVGPRWEGARAVGRLMIGKTFTFGDDHEGYYTNAQHAALNWSPVVWLGLLIWTAVEGFHLWRISFTEVLLLLPPMAVVVLAGLYVYRHTFRRRHFRERLEPLRKTVGDLCGWPRSVSPWLWLHIPRDLDESIRIEFKYDAANDDEKQKKILQALERILGKLDPRYIVWETDPTPSPWPLTVTWPYLLIRPECPPPDEAWFVDNVRTLSRYKRSSEIVLGIGCFERVEMVDIDNDAPHAVIAADSGRGKSTAEALVGAQMAHKGAVLSIIDPKIISLRAFKGLPNVAYFGGEEAAHHGLLALKAEMKRRAEMLDVPWEEKPPDVGPRLMVLIEEADSLVAELRDWKQDEGEGRSNVRSITAMSRLRNMGRELKIHVFIVTQTGGANALGGAGSQTGFGLQLISANHKGIWTKLAPQVTEVPPQSEHLGRWHLNRPGSGDTPVEVQCFGFPRPKEGEEHWKFKEAREYAVSGKIGVIPDLLQEALDLVASLKDTKVSSLDTKINGGVSQGQGGHVSINGVSQGQGRPNLYAVPNDQPLSFVAEVLAGRYDEETVPSGRLLTLVEAVQADILPFPSIAAAKKASQRPGFPYPDDEPRPSVAGGLPARQWPEGDLADWAQMTPVDRLAKWPARGKVGAHA